MGLPRRAAHPDPREPRSSEPRFRDRHAKGNHDDDEPSVSVADWFDEEQSAPWCVDRGSSIEVMSSGAVYRAVDRGELSVDTKVWRDGRAFWLPISECHELTIAPPPPRRVEETPISRIRRVRPRTATDDGQASTAPTTPTGAAARWRSLATPRPRRSCSSTPASRPAGSGAGGAAAGPERRALMLTTSFAVGVLLGALLYLPFAW